MKFKVKDLPMSLDKFSGELEEVDVYKCAQALVYRKVDRVRGHALLKMFGELILPDRGVQGLTVENATLLIAYQLTVNRCPTRIPKGLKSKLMWFLIKVLQRLARI
jgi:hypothetical protein